MGKISKKHFPFRLENREMQGKKEIIKTIGKINKKDAIGRKTNKENLLSNFGLYGKLKELKIYRP